MSLSHNFLGNIKVGHDFLFSKYSVKAESIFCSYLILYFEY